MSSLCTIVSPSQVCVGPGGCFTEVTTDSKLARVSAGDAPRFAATPFSWTLSKLAVGLLAPSEGEIAVFGETSRAHTADTLTRVSYLAQDHPLYRGFTVTDMFHFGRAMNPRWDHALAQARMDALGIPLEGKIKTLSGGQQAQVSLTMALAKRAPLLALDEPVASLDPIARLEFMRDVMAEAGTGLTVIIASHVISELERLCDLLLVLTGGRVQLAGPVDGLLAAHQVLTVPRQTPGADLPGTVISRSDSDRHSTVLVTADLGQLAQAQRPGWQAEPVSFEQLLLAYLQRPAADGAGERPRATRTAVTS